MMPGLLLPIKKYLLLRRNQQKEKGTTIAKNLGIEGLNKPDHYGLALVLGGGEVKLVNNLVAPFVYLACPEICAGVFVE